jgi:hypothetical protein
MLPVKRRFMFLLDKYCKNRSMIKVCCMVKHSTRSDKNSEPCKTWMPANELIFSSTLLSMIAGVFLENARIHRA